ncbi:GGDEF domain-containing protein [Endothiovibrio diazotrophicus]
MSDDWKEKYEESIDRLQRGERQWRQTEELLHKALSRISIAAEGLDPRLDQELRELRNAIRGHRTDESKLYPLIDRLSETLAGVEEERARKESEPRQALAELLARLPLSGKAKRRAEGLRERLAGSDDSLADLEAQCAALIGDALDQGGGRGLFGGLLKRDNGEPSASSSGGGAPPVPGEGVGPVLLRLLEKLAVPPEFNDRAEALRRELLGEAAQWQRAVDELAALIAAMASKAQHEKRELEGFVYQMSTRLKELDVHLRGAEALRTESKRSGEALNAAVQAEVRDLHDTAQRASDLEQLKRDVSHRMEAIGQRMDAFRRAEDQRHNQSEQRMAQMQQRLATLEKESGELRERVRVEQRRALHDPLTGLANRLAFDERAHQELARRERYDTPLSLLVLDVDFFKRVNDSYGHKAGDMVLRTIAQLLLKLLRETDFLARFGGEEFIALLPETPLEAAQQVAEKLRRGVAECGFHFQGQAVPITISIGITQYRHGETHDSAFERADGALYQAKESGRNRCVTDA